MTNGNPMNNQRNLYKLPKHLAALAVVTIGTILLGGVSSDAAEVVAPPTLPSTGKAVTSETNPLPVGEVRLEVPRGDPYAVALFRMTFAADIHPPAQIEVKNLTEGGPSTTFPVMFEAELQGYIGKDRISIALNSLGQGKHELYFELFSDYSVEDGCKTDWASGKQKEIWSVKVSGGSNGSFTGIPIGNVGVKSFNLGRPCSSFIEQQLRRCIDPAESPVVRPSSGSILGCLLGGPKKLKAN